MLKHPLSEQNETTFEFLAMTVVYTLAKLPTAEPDRQARGRYAPVVKAAAERWSSSKECVGTFLVLAS